ncbi:MAG: GH92 family glycosyl hydrolase [Thermoleophilaceae bacterium]|nr:GH92 family glycosyl hydrolase [Thermoleophilaceae bacterium]
MALALCAAASPASARGLADEVNPFIGTLPGAADFGTGGGAGNTFPGATTPFGMVAFSPDTHPRLDGLTSYHYGDSRLKGFSLTHFSGAGCFVYGDVPLLPITARLSRSPVTSFDGIDPNLLPAFGHRRERARPGAYSVTLDPGTPRAIAAELTATARTGAARFTFARGARRALLVNTGGSINQNTAVRIAIDPRRRELSGMVESRGFCVQPTSHRVYFSARFDHPLSGHGTWAGDRLERGSRRVAVSGGGGAYVEFGGRGRRVEARVGISFVSVAGARANLAEARGRSFAALRSGARRTWDRALGRVSVGGGRGRDRAIFASSLYRALLEPSVFSDRDGRYLGMDGRVHRARGFTKYADISGWDVYRGQTQLMAMLFPRRAADVATSMLADARESGCLPRWPYANQQTNVMVGDPAAPMLASTLALGAARFDTRAALRALLRGADRPCHTANGDYTEREALAEYLKLGYVPHELDVDVIEHTFGARDRPWGSTATTLEYAIADFAISRLALARGDRGTARRLTRRAGTWRRLVNPGSRTIQPRLASGAFMPGFTPAAGDSYVEGSGAQYSWLVPHDPAGLFASMGGRAAARARLDRFFEELNGGPESEHAFMSNEPNLGVPWLYDWLGRPDRTQDVVRRTLLDLYGPGPAGMPGNDDGGTMSAWWVFGALGLYPAVPGTDVLALGSPLFPRVTVRLPRGTLRILAPRAAPGRPYVRSLRLGGGAWKRPWLRYRQLARGGELRFALGGRPSSWGSGAGLAPPSFGP